MTETGSQRVTRAHQGGCKVCTRDLDRCIFVRNDTSSLEHQFFTYHILYSILAKKAKVIEIFFRIRPRLIIIFDEVTLVSKMLFGFLGCVENGSLWIVSANTYLLCGICILHVHQAMGDYVFLYTS